MEERNIIALTDENGVENEFEVLATLEIDETEYAILLPLDEEEGDEALVFKIVREDGEEILEYVEDDEEIELVAQAYDELLEDE